MSCNVRGKGQTSALPRRCIPDPRADLCLVVSRLFFFFSFFYRDLGAARSARPSGPHVRLSSGEPFVASCSSYRYRGNSEPLCRRRVACATCNTRPLLNAGLLRGSARAPCHEADTRQRIGCPRPMTLRAGLTTPRKTFSMRAPDRRPGEEVPRCAPPCLATRGTVCARACAKLHAFRCHMRAERERWN